MHKLPIVSLPVKLQYDHTATIHIYYQSSTSGANETCWGRMSLVRKRDALGEVILCSELTRPACRVFYWRDKYRLSSLYVRQVRHDWHPCSNLQVNLGTHCEGWYDMLSKGGFQKLQLFFFLNAREAMHIFLLFIFSSFNSFSWLHHNVSSPLLGGQASIYQCWCHSNGYKESNSSKMFLT